MDDFTKCMRGTDFDAKQWDVVNAPPRQEGATVCTAGNWWDEYVLVGVAGESGFSIQDYLDVGWTKQTLLDCGVIVKKEV